MSEVLEQLQQDLSKKNMFFSKDSIEIFKVIGEGMYMNMVCVVLMDIYVCHIFLTGQSGVVYRGYFKTQAGKQLVAIKTCKGMLL